MKTTNRKNTFISVAEDCPISIAEIPPKRTLPSVAQREHAMIIDHPYTYTADDVLYATHGKNKGIPRDVFFAKTQPDFRLSPLTKRYGWGVHNDINGKIALYAVESVEYAKYSSDKSLKQLQGNRSKRRSITLNQDLGRAR